MLIQYYWFYKILEVGWEGGMLYIYEVMKLVGYIINKHAIKKHKEYSTTWYQNCLHKMKNKKVMRSQSYKVKMVYPPPPPPPPLMNLTPPSGKSTFVEYHQLIVEKSQLYVEDMLGKSKTVLWSSFCIRNTRLFALMAHGRSGVTNLYLVQCMWLNIRRERY